MRGFFFIFFIASCAAQAQQPPAQLKRLLQNAHEQVGKTLYYDSEYRRIAFPGGDIPIERGVCTDVLIRAYRSIEIDLQKLVHQDMQRAFAAYPKTWKLSKPDTNIDHRRVPNLAVFFSRHGQALPVTMNARDYQPGDIVTWRLSTGVPHIGLVSDRQENDMPLVVHNIGAGAQIENVLFSYEITGHYRY